jgi:hypothetical protein
VLHLLNHTAGLATRMSAETVTDLTYERAIASLLFGLRDMNHSSLAQRPLRTPAS